MMLNAGLVVALLFSAQVAAAPSDTCESYQDRMVAPITIDQAIERLSAAPLEKGEFESSAEFSARQRAALGGEIGPWIISKEPDRNHIKYDPDTRLFTISIFAFDNLNFPHKVVFGPGTPQYGKIRYSLTDNVDLVFSRSETLTGTYQSGNAFGAKAEVKQIRRQTKAIFDRAGDSFNALWLSGMPTVPIKLTMDASAAQKIKPQLQTAFVVQPRSPYLVRGEGQVIRPTIQRPLDVTDEVTVITADIQCALLIDGSNRVLGSFPTN